MTDTVPFAELMAQLRSGDQPSAALVVDTFARRLVGLARAKLPAPIRAKEDPEDAVQSAFRSFFVRHRDGGLDPADWDELWGLLTYLTACKVDRRVRKYLAVKRDVRREGRPADPDGSGPGFEPAAPDPTPAEAAMLAETVAAVAAKLRPTDREVLTLRLQGYGPAEIAALVGRSERTVFRVLDQIRELVTGLLASEDGP